MKRPLSEGRLQVRDPGLANLALGGNILSKIFSKHCHPLSQVLIKKYLHGLSINNIDEGASCKGTTPWTLCSRGWEFFKDHLYRIPGNGKRIRMWEDKIMGLQPLNSAHEIVDLCDCLTQHGIHKLADISSWGSHGNWLDWAFHHLLDRLHPQHHPFFAVILGLILVHLYSRDKWGGGKTSAYIVSQGFAALQDHHS